jgi:hypothetical protein
VATDLAEDEVDLPEISEQESVPKQKFDFRSKKVKTFALLLLVMLVEAAGIYVWLPDPPAMDGLDQTRNELENVGLDVDTAEAKIADFRTTNTRAATQGSEINITFTLAAVVSVDAKADFEDAVKNNHQFRVRQAVEGVCRSATLQDLTDPELGTIKRLVRSEINKVLAKSYIIVVIISDWQVREL